MCKRKHGRGNIETPQFLHHLSKWRNYVSSKQYDIVHTFRWDISDIIKGKKPSRIPHNAKREWTHPTNKWTHTNNCTNNQICYVAESEITGIFVTVIKNGDIFPKTHRNEMDATPSPIQTNNSTSAGVINKTIVPKWTKSMDMRFYWPLWHEEQQQFRLYWDKGSNNLGDYHTKHHPQIYHETHRPTHAG